MPVVRPFQGRIGETETSLLCQKKAIEAIRMIVISLISATPSTLAEISTSK